MKNRMINTALVMAMANEIGKFQRPSGTSPSAKVKPTSANKTTQITTYTRGVKCTSASAWSKADSASRLSGIDSDMLAGSDQIQKRIEEDPDDVDEMPIQPQQMDARRVGAFGLAVAGLVGKPDQNPQPDHHVQGVQTGHQKVEIEEQ